ncbi:hypothetical protein KSX_35130 [Ktedonospora formicarum]|uniref:Uncharacterized protein n=1 Tax=Ktedonospora formicarum TaxID=2778364 RepID=A0A8J3MUF4_9CHLR|nr:hypothetical protein KSX_35130 [Ktedonospora formicarum]
MYTYGIKYSIQTPKAFFDGTDGGALKGYGSAQDGSRSATIACSLVLERMNVLGKHLMVGALFGRATRAIIVGVVACAWSVVASDWKCEGWVHRDRERVGLQAGVALRCGRGERSRLDVG